jgi:hypothetical protein
MTNHQPTEKTPPQASEGRGEHSGAVVSPACEFRHATVTRAWLCVTAKDDAISHHHVCGIHAKQFRRETHVFRALDEDNPGYEWLAPGYGCQRAHKRRGVAVRCTTCGLTKKPIGRSAPLEMANGMCDFECPGYQQEPRVGDLWPGETCEQFGYDHGHEATEQIP